MTSQPFQQIQDMWDEINSIHLSYLQTEECLKKIKEQDRLEDVIKQYLSLVPHDRKFYFGEIPFILQTSVRDKKDFSGSKAISAWSAFAKYAHNLLSQPWRKEFYEIQKYGGFFSHNIKCALVDWEIVFELMGYKADKDIMVLEEPIDPDKITFIARDCLTAQVECQIMLKIYAKVLKLHSECTWQDILYYRENHICTAEQAIYGLNRMFMQRKQDEYVRDSCTNTVHPPYTHSTLGAFPSGQSMIFSNDIKHLPQYSSMLNYDTLNNDGSNNRVQQDECDFHPVPQGYEFSNCSKHLYAPSLHHLTPTEYLPHANNAYNMTYEPGKSMNSQYMYRNNSQFHCMDPLPLNERELCSNCYGLTYNTMYPYNCNRNCMKYKGLPYNYIGPYNSHMRSKSLGKYDNAMKQSTDSQHWQKGTDYNTFYSGNVPKYAPVTKSDLENAMKAFSFDDFDKSTFSEHDQQSDKISISSSENKKDSSSSKNGTHKSDEIHKDLWECSYCTYHNSSKNFICEICHKSKVIGNENLPLISGGRECHQCTLVNEKDATVCLACESSLEDSPTYI